MQTVISDDFKGVGVFLRTCGYHFSRNLCFVKWNLGVFIIEIMLDRSIIMSIFTDMNQLTNEKRAQVVACLVEGNSLRSTVRLTGAHRTTIQNLLADLGTAVADYQSRVFRNLPCKRLQCDEIWSFVGCKERNATKEHKARGCGDCWTWTALDADTKLIPCWYVGPRDMTSAHRFIQDLAGRLANRVQLTTDGHRPYLTAVESAFGTEIDYAVLQKIYGKPEQSPETRYSPAQCRGVRKEVVNGSPDKDHVSTSFVERSNLTLRMCNRRFTRLTNAFSKKMENHAHSIALFAMHYNFCRIHQSLRVTPAMAAGLTDHVWEAEEVVALLDKKCEEKAA